MPAIPRIPEFWGKFFALLYGYSKIVTVRSSVNPASVAAEASGDTTIVATGAALGDLAEVTWETDVWTGVNAPMPHAWVSAADQVSIKVTNNNVAAGAAIDIAATNCQITVWRRING